MKLMKNKIIAVGITTQNNKLVNGQSMMFQLFMDELVVKNVKPIIVDFGVSLKKNNDKRISGKFSILKMIDNILIFNKFLYTIVSNLGTPVYITTSQSKVGFIRDFLFINLSRMLGSKVVAHQFGSNYQHFYNSQSDFIKKNIRNTLQKADKIVVEGDFTKQQFNFLPDYEQKVVCIPNGLPEKINSSDIFAKNISNDKTVNLIYLSNLIETKGYWDVLEAVNILVNERKLDVKATFSGRFLKDLGDTKFATATEAKDAFFHFLEKNNLQDRVKYYEGLFGSQKSEAFRNSHFFLLPSYYINEGQPVSIVEALAYGCVPIVTNYRLIPTMVNEDNGIFVNSKSPQKIADVIEKFINDPQKYEQHSQAGINFYLNNFTADKYVNRLMSLFK